MCVCVCPCLGAKEHTRFCTFPLGKTSLSLSVQGVQTQCSTRVLVSGSLNYETSSTEVIIVRASDQDGAVKLTRFSITILDAGDPPTVRLTP